MQEAIETATHLRVDQIQPGANPRKHFDKDALEELANSIKAQGVLQPILVRPVEGGYQIVAGQRRWTAAKMAHGETYEIPVFIREMTDAEADAAATNENVIREAMSPSEEAEAAAKVLGNCAGNKTEAAARLGWTVSTLEKRLALMNCSQGVRDALTERKIQLGHAELLATATKEKQDQVLNKLLEMPKMPSISDFKAQLEQISKSLASAIFEKSQCAGCQYNSSNQQALFAESISDGHCTNSACYDRKTESELLGRSDALREEFPVVKIVKPGENFAVIRIVSEGKNAVGPEQSKACRSCANFGAAISAIPGSVGNVYKEQCFDPVCNAKKVAAFIKSQQPAPETAKETGKQATDTKPTQKTVKEKVEVQDSTRVKDYRTKIWRKMLVSELMSQKDKNLIVLLAVGICGLGRLISGNKLSQAFNKLTGDSVKNSTDILAIATALQNAKPEMTERLHMALAASIEGEVEVRQLTQILQFLNASVEKHWKVNDEYLDLLTKSEIEVVADEIGLKAHMGEKFSSLMSGKKADLIKALLATEGFVFEGKVPKNMQLP